MKDKYNTSKRIRSLNQTMSIRMYKGSTRHQPLLVIDPGLEQDIVSVYGYHILHLSDKPEKLNGPLSGMGSTVLPKVDIVTAGKYQNGKMIIIGVGGTAYDRQITQYESLWNSHHMISNGVVVEEKAKDIYGSPLFKVRGNS